jgi:hypothetical protein
MEEEKNTGKLIPILTTQSVQPISNPPSIFFLFHVPKKQYFPLVFGFYSKY